MGKVVSTSGNNGKGDKSILYKKKEKFYRKKIAKKTPIDKRSVEKAAKVFTSGQKGRKLDKSHSSSANKGHKQLEDDVEVMERDADMDERENSSNAESEESGAENMSDVSDADDNQDETDVDNEDDDAGPTDVEEPEIEDRGKTFNGKKGSKTGQAGRKSTDSKRKNYAEPEPCLRPR